MKAILKLAVIALGAFGLYNYFSNGSFENVTVTGDAVVVDAGNFISEFSISGEFQKTYMVFGGGYFKNKNLINPISLSGLNIADAKNIYAQFPDFHRCSSPGASLAIPKTKHLNIIPADNQVLDELRASIKEHERNFSKGKERICVSLTGKTLDTQSTEVPGKNSTEDMIIIHQIPRQPFYLITSSARVSCKNLLDQV